jgi:hypothetical protein
MESRCRTTTAQRGIALPLVLAVLVCLLAIAVPFALSMRHEQGGAAWRGADADVRREAASVRDLALARFAAASESDTTRWSDPPDRLKVDVEAAAQSLGIADLGPRARLLSASLDDQAGRVDLNRAPLFLMAKVLGLESHLARKLSPDDKEIHLLDGDFLQDEGFLWIDGEVTYYKRREGATVGDFTRPAIVPGVWEPAKMSGDPREFEAGTAVVDMRAWMAAAWVWKSPEIARPGAEARFESPTHAFAVASFGRGAFGEVQRERIARYATIFSADADRKRFGNPQRVLSALVGGTTAELRIEQGQFAGPGSLCRVTTFERKVDYGFVRKVDMQDDGAKLTLEMPLLVTADPGQAVAEFLVARPVNVNSCSPELLRLLLTGLKLRGKQTEVDEKTADLVATRMAGARPFNGMKEFMALLDVLVDKEKVLKDEQRLAILLNAENSASSQIEGGTAPFCWASDGVVEVRAAASRNYPLTGREKARAFVRDVVDVGGVGRTTRLFATQRDFEQPWWSSRMARGWTSFPENLDVMDGPYGAGAALPAGRLPAMLAPHSRFPAEDLNSTGARLAASRMYGSGVQFDKTWHFAGGRGDWDSTDPDGWRVSDGPQHVNPNGDENGVQISINVNPYGVERPRPLGVSLWWTPGKSTGTDQTLVDWRCNSQSGNPDSIDRIHLQFKAGKLVFEVDDAFRRDSSDDKYSSRIVYDFTDGLPLEGDTWYHVTAFCRGNRGGQMCLWVDGKPRGKWTHMTRTTSAFDGAAKSVGNIAIDGKRLAEGTAKFPSQGAVIVGGQVFEYTGISGSSLTTERDVAKRFGGVRPAPPPDQSQVGGTNLKKTKQAISNAQKAQTQHPAQSVVELYGYVGRLGSDIPAGSATLDTDGLGKFGVAMIDPKSAKVQLTLKGDQGKPIPLGQGIENDAQEIELLQLDSNKLQASDKAFQKNGGYALVVSYEFGLMRAQDTNDKKNEANLKDLTPLGSIVGGAEVIFYEGFNGTKLTGVARGQSLTQELGKTDFGSKSTGNGQQQGGQEHYLEKHAWLLTPSGIWTNYKPKFFTVLVIPIGVRAPGANLKDHFLEPIERNGSHLPELLQIDSEFDGTSKNETEWVRYTAIVTDRRQGTNFLRASPGPIGWTRWWLQGGTIPSGDSSQFNGNQGVDQLYEIANAGSNGTGWAPNGTEYKKLIDGINYEQLDPLTTDPNRLAFRGVLGTVNSEHAGSAKLLPVFRVNRRTGRLGHDALPGRYDEVTVVSSPDLPMTPERFIVNYAWCGQYCEGWQIDQYSHVALLDQAPSKRVLFTKRLDFDFSDPKQAAAAVTNLADSRNFARILKHPSGELPNQWDGASSLAIGGDGNGSAKAGGAATPGGGGGGGGDGGGKVDEVRVFGCADPEEYYPQATYFLQNALEVGEENRMLLAGDALRAAHGTLGFGIPNAVGLHGDACVVQIGDDFVECAERQTGLPMTQNIAENGRHVFVTDPAYHSAGEPVQVLPWLVQSRLSSAISATESRLSIADGKGFPHRGYVMIDQEILAYTDLAGGDGGVQLYCPSTMHALGTGSTQRQHGEAVFRGRFGTGAQPHAADAIVTWWPNRYDDGYAPRCDIPEMASLELPVAARRALFHSVVWRTQPGDAGPDLVLTARVMGRGHFAADTDTDPDLFFFEQSGTPDKPNLIDRQGDLLLLRFNVRYRAGVLNLTDFTGNGWKRAPLLQTVGVDYIADRVTELHEESR